MHRVQKLKNKEPRSDWREWRKEMNLMIFHHVRHEKSPKQKWHQRLYCEIFLCFLCFFFFFEIRIKASNMQCAVRGGYVTLASSVFSEYTSFSLDIRVVLYLFWYFVIFGFNFSFMFFFFCFSSVCLCNVHSLHVYNVPECIW